jgi:hypothetical protein
MLRGIRNGREIIGTEIFLMSKFFKSKFPCRPFLVLFTVLVSSCHTCNTKENKRISSEKNIFLIRT